MIYEYCPPQRLRTKARASKSRRPEVPELGATLKNATHVRDEQISVRPIITTRSPAVAVATGDDDERVDGATTNTAEAGNEGSAAPAKKRRLAYVGSVEGVEKAIRWKRRCGIPLGDVAEEWRDVLPRDLFNAQATLGDRADGPIDIDAI